MLVKLKLVMKIERPKCPEMNLMVIFPYGHFYPKVSFGFCTFSNSSVIFEIDT
jgi:hypothetical protein